MANVSIIIATLNCEDQISDCIDSILKCCDDTAEIIIQDGLSVDNTLKILNSYCLDFVSEPDLGIYDAFNKALKRVRGEWVIFMGADDRLMVDLDSIVSGYNSCDCQVIYGNVIHADTGLLYDGFFSRLKFARQNICQQAIIYPASIFKNYSFDLRYKFLSDYHFNLMLLGEGYRFNYLNKCWIVYGNNGISKLGDEVFEMEKLRIIYEKIGFWIFILYGFGRYLKRKIKFFQKGVNLLCK